jgi:hypothetical protein
MMDEQHEQQEDLELAEREAERVTGGAVPDVSKVPPTPGAPPGVPVPYPNISLPKK